MADDDSQVSSDTPHPGHDLISQLRAVTEKLAGLTGLTGLAESLPSMPSLPRPAALSAAQLDAVASTVTAQRRSIEAMQAQLQAFNDQLTVMEKILEPLTEWTTALAHLEKTVMDLRPGADG
jgi:uncharacterized coiled-coil protein SlyX